MHVLVYRDPAFLNHRPGPYHPERAERLRAVYSWLDAVPPAGIEVRRPAPATEAQILRVHTRAHLDRVTATRGLDSVWLDPDTQTSAGSCDAAFKAAGAVCQAVEAVVRGEGAGAFALVRPPGHHAERDAAMGFCLFNNVAVAAAHALSELSIRRVLILDPDVHHGNGTQRTFWLRDRVLYASTHRWPFYPGTGTVDEVGAGPGEGYTVNFPLPEGQGDADLVFLYRDVLGPLVDVFRPELILVSAGFDTWAADPIGGMKVTEAGYRALFEVFRGWADRHCPGRIVFALEGGYDLDGVVAGVRAGLDALLGHGEVVDPGAPGEAAKKTADEVRKTLAPYWPGVFPT